MFLICWWLAPSFFKLFTKATFEEFQAPIWLATGYLEKIATDAVNKTKSKQELIEKIRELQRKNAYYEQIKNINENYKSEINRLESILKLPSRDHFRYEVAHVIQRNMGSWWQTIQINKGSKHGIQKVMLLFLLAVLLGVSPRQIITQAKWICSQTIHLEYPHLY